MPVRVFVDSNIWLYSLIEGDHDKHRQAVALLMCLDYPVISSQVIREVCSNLKKKTPISEAQLRSLIHAWHQDCIVVGSNLSQFLLASNLREKYAFSYWDSLIVAAALDAGCTELFSEDMQHGQTVENGPTIINPFVQ